MKDHTAVKTFMECPRKYFYRMVLGREAKKSGLETIFGWGLAIHKFAEVYGQTGDGGLATGRAFKLFVPPALSTQVKWQHLNLERLSLTLKLVKDFIDEETRDGFTRTKEIEQPFNMKFPDGHIIGGRWDAIITFMNQAWVRDWKTTTKPILWFRGSLDPNDQATRYVYALSRLRGWDSTLQPMSSKAEGVQFVVISNQTPTKTQKHLPVLEKIPIHRTSEQLVTWEKEQVLIHKQMDDCRNEDLWPMNPTSCTFCDYRDVCRQPTDSSREYKLKSEFVVSYWDHAKVDQTVTSEG